MNYREAEQFFYSLLNIPGEYYLEHPRAGKIFLTRLRFFLDLIGNPEKAVPHYIHVAGTSGKGSVCAYLHNVLRASGRKTGLYVSPHPGRLTERWQINGRPMGETEFAKIMEFFKIKLAEYIRVSPYDTPSFFELDTAVALYYFAEKKVEWAVIEVGMGGRFDATNVLPWKDAAVITNIGLDHTEFLGDTKEKIAFEKAGIINQGGAVFTMEEDEKVVAVIKKECVRKKTKLRITNYELRICDNGIDGSDFLYKNNRYHLNAIGVHQVKNASLVIDVAEYLGFPMVAIKKGLASAYQPLRLEVISDRPLVILDGAHNPDKMKTTVEAIKHLRKNGKSAGKKNDDFGRIHLVVGFSEDKNVKFMIRQLASLRPATVAGARNTDNPFRKVAAPQDIRFLFAKNLDAIVKTEIFLDPMDAFQWAKSNAKKNDIILATGSIFFSGEIRRKLRITN